MPNNIGTLITAPIRPQDPNDPIPSAHSNEILGGVHHKLDIVDRDSIIPERRYIGMFCTVEDDGTGSAKTYQLLNTLDNTGWVEFSSGSGSDTLGSPTDGTYTDGFFQWPADNTYKKDDAIDDLNTMLKKLAPPPPPDLSTLVLIIDNLYTALESGTGTTHADCIDDNTPRAYVSQAFGDGANGVLDAEIDSTNMGSITLTTNNDVGSDNDLFITSDTDPYVGVAGEGLYSQLEAYILPVTPLSVDEHIFVMKHSITGNTPDKHVHIDDPDNANISSPSIGLPASCTRYVSGVPSLDVGDTLDCTYTIDDAVRSHYINALSRIESLAINNIDVSLSIIPTAYTSVTMNNITTTTINNIYVENIIINIMGRNSKSILGTPLATNTNARIDTISDETPRVISGTGQYPTNGYGGSFDSTVSLRSTYVDELQMLDNRYGTPNGDYSTNNPTAGPDYSTGMGSGTRWVTFKPVTLNNNSAFTLTLPNPIGTWSGVETNGIEIYYKVEGVTGWLNGNSSYPGVGSPVNDGDKGMVYSESTTNIKKCTFGSTVRSGELYIRIGLPNNSDKKFGNIIISNIV